MAPQFKADPNLSYGVIANYLMTNYGVTVGQKKMYRARKKAQELVEGNHAKSYSKLRKYAMLVGQSNPGSEASLHVERLELTQNPIFKRFFLCLDAMKKGFKLGCRPFIGLDGCHLKGPYGGVFLTAVSLDGNNGLFPVACAIVETENRDSWTWFLQLLESSIDDPSMNHKPLIIMSDRQKGLEFAIPEVIPYAQRRVCSRHMYNNFRAKYPSIMLKTLFWKAAKAYAVWEFDAAMEEIRKVDVAAFQYLKGFPATTWARSAFDGRACSDHITNNMSESFNNWIGQLRDKPVLTIIENLVQKNMGKVHNKYAEGCKWQHNVIPFVLKKLESLKCKNNRCSLVPSGQMEFQVSEDTKRFCVDLRNKTYNCNYWQKSGLPCKHALTAIINLRHDQLQYCDEQFSKDKYLLSYNEVVHPVPDLSMVHVHEEALDLVLPPVLKRLPGRPRRKRRLEEGEASSGAVKRSSTVQCMNCKQFGHNKRTCQRAPVAAKKKASNRAIRTATQSSESQASTSSAHAKKRKKVTVVGSKTRMGRTTRSSIMQITALIALDISVFPSTAPANVNGPTTQLSQPHKL